MKLPNTNPRRPDRRREHKKGLSSIFSLVLIVVLVTSLTIGGTLAFLQHPSNTVTNTFSLGQITYTLNLNANATKVGHQDSEVTMPATLDPTSPHSTTNLSVPFEADAVPTLAGYTFNGWHYEDSCTTDYMDVSNDGKTITVNYGDRHDKNSAPNQVEIALYADWTANTDTPYRVEHHLQNILDDEYTIYNQDTQNLTGTTDSEVTPAVKTYEGFTSPATQTVTIKGDGSTVVVYKYTRNEYTVNLTAGTGIASVTGEDSYKYGATVNVSATVKPGYTWANWTGEATKNEQNFSFAMPAKDVAYTANATLNTYSITYDLDGGTVSTANPTTYTVETESFTLNNPTKTGYIFSGWTGSNGTTAQTTVTVAKGSTGDKNFTANWTPITYTVKYDGNGATSGSTADSTHKYDEAKALTSNGYTKTGYEFLGWSTDKNATTATYTNMQSVTNLTTENGATIQLYAVWKQMDFKLSFVSNLSGVANPAEQTVTYGKAYGTLPAPTHAEYNFMGWTFTKDGTDYVTADTIVNKASNHTVYGKWVEKSKYTITYYANATDASFDGGAKQVTDTKIHDTNYTIKTPTELSVNRGDNWTWTEWNTKPDGTGTKYLGTNVYTANQNLTLYAIWKTKTDVAFGVAQFVNMDDTSQIPGKDDYNFTIKCKTRGGADGISIPIYNLTPGYAYRLTFSVSFNDFKFYTEDSHGYIFGTNIVESTAGYHRDYSILEKAGAKVTHKYENMQWSTEKGGTFNVTLDFEASQSTMFWFWETTDIVDGNEMHYVFNNFNIHMLKEDGPYGARVAFEDLTVKFDEAPNVHSENITPSGQPIDTSRGTSYGTRWIDYKNSSGSELTARHKNYFHTEYYGFDNLQYRLWGYNGHEVMTIPIEGLVVGQTYELSFTQNLNGAIVYNTSSDSLNTIQLYGCAVTATKDMDASYTTSNSVNKQSNYQDLRKAKVGAISNQSVVFTATAETMYWQWLLGDLKDARSNGWQYSVVKLSNVKITTSNKPVTVASLNLEPETELPNNELPEGVTKGEEVILTEMPDMAELEASVAMENKNLYGWMVDGFFGSEIYMPDQLEEILEGVFADAAEYGDEVELHIFPLYTDAPAEPSATDPTDAAPTEPTATDPTSAAPTDPASTEPAQDQPNALVALFTQIKDALTPTEPKATVAPTAAATTPPTAPATVPATEKEVTGE